MKRILLILILVLIIMCSTNAFAELAQGDWLIEATSEFSLTRVKIEPENAPDEKITITGFDIAAEKLITNNISLGGSISYEKQDTDTDDTTTTFILLSGTFWLQPEEKINPFISLGLGRIDMDFDGIDGDGFGYGGSLGMLYFLNNNVALNFAVAYLRGDLDVEGIDVEYDGLGFGAGFAIKF